MHCRVYIKPDGSLAVLRPNPRCQARGEDDLDFVHRIASRDAGELAGLPFVDVLVDSLPPRSTRKGWRIRNGRVMVEP